MNLAGAILAGGAGSRMASLEGPKPLLLLAGRPLVAHVAERLSGKVYPLVVNSRIQEGFETLGLPVIPDLRPERLGPLAGMEAVSAYLSTAFPQVDHVLFAPGDTPFLPDDFVARMCAGIGPVRIAASRNRLHPTASLWPLAALSGLSAHLAKPESRRSVLAYARSVGFETVAFDDSAGVDPFFNINQPNELMAARAYLEP